MLQVMVGLSVLLPAAALAAEVRVTPPHRLVTSPFWYVTFIFLAAFPLRAWLIHFDYVEAQVAAQGAVPAMSPEQLTGALVVALVFWVAMFLGHVAVNRRPTPVAPAGHPAGAPDGRVAWRPFVVAGALFVVAIASILYLSPTMEALNGLAYFASRSGTAIFWVAAELPVYGSICIAAALVGTAAKPGRTATIVIVLIVFAVTFWVSGMLSTRRVFAAAVLCFVVLPVLRFPRAWPLGLVAVVGTVFSAPLFELIRYFHTLLLRTSEMGFSKALESVINHSSLKLLSTSFEGVEHVARYLDKASVQQLLLGVDHGVSWLFNLGLSFVPRAIWPGKPMVYGGMEQFRWLYPSYFQDGVPSTAVPCSFVVDLSFGFGLVVGLGLAFFLGRFLSACGAQLWRRDAAAAGLAIALCVYVFSFNTVRGGTALAQSLILVGFVGVLTFGVRPMLAALAEILATTFGVPPRRRRSDHG